jgi:hypothetical protein
MRSRTLLVGLGILGLALAPAHAEIVKGVMAVKGAEMS